MLSTECLQMIYPSNSEWFRSYDVRNWQRLSLDQRPAAFALPQSVDDLAAALSCGESTRVPIAIRSGGHSTEGTSRVKGGVVIDMSK